MPKRFIMKKGGSPSPEGEDGDGNNPPLIVDDSTEDNVKQVIKMIKILTYNIQVLQVVSESTTTDESKSTAVETIAAKIKSDIEILNTAIGKLKDNNNITETIDAINIDDPPYTSLQDEKKEKLRILTPTSEGGGAWKGRKMRGGFADEVSMVTVDSMDTSKIAAFGTGSAPNPMTSALNGTDVLLKSPDSFSAGSYAFNTSVSRDIAQIITPALGGQSGGAKRKSRTNKKK